MGFLAAFFATGRCTRPGGDIALRGQIIDHGLSCGIVERNQTVLVALAAHHDHSRVLTRGGDRQRDQLRDAQAGCVQNLKQTREPQRPQSLR